MLKALGLPTGGAIKIGRSHVHVSPADMASPTDLVLSLDGRINAGVSAGESVDVKRAMLVPAQVVRFEVDEVDARRLSAALTGMPVTTGDSVTIESGYNGGDGPVTLKVLAVEPDGVGLIGSVTQFASGRDTPAPAVAPPPVTSTGPPDVAKPNAAGAAKKPAEPAPTTRTRTAPTTEEALLAGLDNELDMVTGWLSLLATNQDLGSAWDLPEVAGVLLEGPNGCGKSELVHKAAERARTTVHEVDISKVFKPESLLDKLSAAVSDAAGPKVIFVDRLETLTGDDALSTFRTQFVAVLRWFLDEVASKPKVVCVLGVESVSALHESIVKSGLLPRTVSIPPPDQSRRKQLLQAAFASVPHEDDLDYDRLSALSSGFSGADILAGVVNASAAVAGNGGGLTMEIASAELGNVEPSLGSVPMGQITGFGFDKVANMADAKQRLTEAVIWPITQPERYERLGIDPPKGILLWGPPGTGKTYICKALAHEAGSAFFTVKGAELLDKYVGESEKGIRDVFARARGAAPSIIFFDEFDALAPTRGGSSNGVTDRVVATLLTEIDGVTDRGQVAVIAATNRKDLIDGALLRAGRFESHIKIDLPEKSARLALLNITDVSLDEDVDLDVLADRTEGLSFADLAGVLREAALAALRSDDKAMSVSWKHVESALGLFEGRKGAITYE